MNGIGPSIRQSRRDLNDRHEIASAAQVGLKLCREMWPYSRHQVALLCETELLSLAFCGARGAVRLVARFLVPLDLFGGRVDEEQPLCRYEVVTGK